MPLSSLSLIFNLTLSFNTGLTDLNFWLLTLENCFWRKISLFLNKGGGKFLGLYFLRNSGGGSNVDEIEWVYT